ncbi:STAS domain-containing protein [Luteimicrobium subarcticum]|uniref:Anti-sigma B factor antagonist n=1 Tax=Luteimicrobium subarcticum TaxID=620910 RepID=A0A2M8WU34_9MICO|nr:STAS domain-containing protein [Luteimicrobium subarcticum]PJI94455.1 anti-sigma B factor antagonist [Luteimicrobium subarcticum]
MTGPSTSGVRVEQDGAHWVMWGEIDAAAIAPVKDAIDDAMSRHATFSLDLGDVTFMDSAGLRVLYLAATTATEPPRLVGTPASVRHLLEIAGVTDLFALTD